MGKVSKIVQFIILITLALGFSFAIHSFFLDSRGLPRYDNLIVRSYFINGLLASLIYLILSILQEKLKNQIGFLFIGGSLVKFIVFFILFYPTYKEDGIMERVEFFAFFVPYLIALIIETFFTFKMLKKLD